MHHICVYCTLYVAYMYIYFPAQEMRGKNSGLYSMCAMPPPGTPCLENLHGVGSEGHEPNERLDLTYLFSAIVDVACRSPLREDIPHAHGVAALD